MASSTDVIVRRNPKPESYIDGKKQAWIFTNEVDAEEWVINESVVTDLVPSSIIRGAKDVNGNGYAWFYTSNKVLQLLQVVQNTIIQTPIMSIDLSTKEITLVGKAYFTKDDGTKALIGTGGSNITQAQLDSILQQAKDFTQSNTTYDYNSVADTTGIFIHHKIGKGNLLDLMVSGVMNQQGYVRAARFKVDVSTKEWSFIIYNVDDEPNSSTQILSGNEDYVNLGLKQLKFLAPATDIQDAVIKFQFDTAITETKAYADTKSNDALTQAKNWVTAQNYVVNSALTNYVTSTSLTTTLNNYITNSALTSTLNGYVTTAAFNTYVNTQGNSNTTYDSNIYSSYNVYYGVPTYFYTNISAVLKYITNNATVFEDYTSFRIPTEIGFGIGYAITNSSNYEWSFRERNSGGSTPLLQFKTTAGVKSIVAPYKIQASGWTAIATTDLTTKGSVDTAINSSDPVGTIKLFIKHATAGLQLPTGYLQCNGSTINSTTYPDLFWAMGSTTLPNLTASAPSGTAYIIKALKTSS